ncbi:MULTISPECIES: cob(I)yrinic acid a,c-diamide adenosyltransferase [Stappia]|jgi:cob(I)alamin adenosyltransferase|uniref:Corrinoid adenosyltransferase n=1 Tax=Stappia indica TaxID=538381 RepID=A0A285RYB8_9HYPH|nr:MULTISPECIES: cob(I)yrinic acid a,c-diamide adenosyltransferase [Stappia]MBC2861397.1 cob(I)yrinic acid a,c-diamide adenosyltransferase [Stappia sp. 28M-7]SOB99457.1 ATP:cob(I)alamin adenosyltransferase [Stappia indica]
MVVLNKIYTKTGDAGTTALASGERRPKHDLRVEAYGTVDETNAVVGLARQATAAAHPELDAVLARIQNDLFDLGADLATPESDEPPAYPPLRVTDAQVSAIEAAIDRFNADLSPLRSFVLPGGSPAAAQLHLARTVSRRAERLMTELASRETVSRPALVYMNRLSDFFFVAARWANDKGAADVLWVPGQNR